MIFDSIIFDMDGTLWDAVDSYCRVWDVTFDETGHPDSTVSRQQLIRCMGMPIGQIYDNIVTNPDIDRSHFLEVLDRNELLLMPELGGKLYPGVVDTMSRLFGSYRLFMVSNCGADGVRNFLALTGLGKYMTDSLTFGQTGLNKTGNINLLRERYDLSSPVYVGDTESDCRATHSAGIPFIHAAYGFGKAPDADMTIDAFTSLPDLLERMRSVDKFNL